MKYLGSISDNKDLVNKEYVDNLIAPAYSSSSAYSVGESVLYNNKLYKCNTAIASPGEVWTAGHWTEVKVAKGMADTTLSCAGTAADAKATGDAVRGDAKGIIPLVFADGKYVKDNGTIGNYASYSCTQYVDITGYTQIRVSSSLASNYCRFYDGSKNPIGSSNFSITSGDTNVSVPSNATYVVLSIKTTNKSDLVLYTQVGGDVARLLLTVANCIKSTPVIDSTATPSAPYDDFDTFPVNSVVTFIRTAGWSDIAHNPGVTDTSRGTVLTYSSSNIYGIVQIATTYNNSLYYRTSSNGTWTDWQLNLTWSYGIARRGDITNTTPYDDFDTLPMNSFFTFTNNNWSGLAHAPNNSQGLVITFSSNLNSYKFQLAIDFDGNAYTRAYLAAWSDWVSLVNTPSDPYDKVNDYYPFSLFERFAVIGDSYASGKIYLATDTPETYDSTENYNLSWGKILARKNGNTCLNLSSSGLSTYSWLSDAHGLALLNSSDAQQLYLCALGINDASSGSTPSHTIGTIADVDDASADTFYGCYGRIIKAIKAKAPNAKIIMIGCMRSNDDYIPYNTAIEALANHFSVPYFNPFDDASFGNVIVHNKMHGHPTAAGYAGIANAIERLISQCIQNNYSYFLNYIGDGVLD